MNRRMRRGTMSERAICGDCARFPEVLDWGGRYDPLLVRCVYHIVRKRPAEIRATTAACNAFERRVERRADRASCRNVTISRRLPACPKCGGNRAIVNVKPAPAGIDSRPGCLMARVICRDCGWTGGYSFDTCPVMVERAAWDEWRA